MYTLSNSFLSQALQAPACHENMIKVGSYIIGEFGNLVAGDPRSGPTVQFQLLHSKYPFCSLGTRALLLSTYIKLVNLYPEIKPQIQAVLEQDSQSRNFDLELQQRAIEYLKLSHIANPDLMVSKQLLYVHSTTWPEPYFYCVQLYWYCIKIFSRSCNVFLSWYTRFIVLEKSAFAKKYGVFLASLSHIAL